MLPLPATSSPLGHTDLKPWIDMMAVNVTANFQLIRCMEPLLKQSDAGRAVFDQIGTRKRGPVRARNYAQDLYLRALKRYELVFAEGPAGTGKTWLAVGHAVSLLEQGVVERLILSRPAVEAGERLGFLPGDMREKVDPYLRRSTTG